MTPAPLLWPYDEVTVEISADNKLLTIKAPWLQATLPVANENESVAVKLAEKFRSQSLGPDDIALVSSVFQALRSYPFAYVLPSPQRGGQADSCDSFALIDKDLLALSPMELLKATIQKSGQKDEELIGDGTIAYFEKILRPEWDWDVQSALAFARLDSSIHPESFFSVSRRFHLLEVMGLDHGREIFQKIESLPLPAYQRMLCLLVRQNHYVTEQCQSALAPALNIAGRARNAIAAFMAEEKGHDQILGAALKHLTEDPERIPVSLTTRTLMHLLRYVAGRNLLGFAMVIDMFERSSYESMDPLARLLARGGYDKAAKQVNRHKEINDAGAHDNVGASFLASMAPCDPAYAYEALRLAELVSQISNHVTSSVWMLFHETSVHS